MKTKHHLAIFRQLSPAYHAETPHQLSPYPTIEEQSRFREAHSEGAALSWDM